jgi:hypothetical protein
MYDEFLKVRYREAVDNPVRRMDLVEIIGSLQHIYQRPTTLQAGTIGHEALAQAAEVLMRLSNEHLPGFYQVDTFREEWDKWADHKKEDRNRRIITDASPIVDGEVVSEPVTKAPPWSWRHRLHRFIGRVLKVSF